MKHQSLRLLLCCMLFSGVAQAHQISTAYLMLDASGEAEIQAQYQVKLADLAHAIKLDLNDDLAITWAEVKTQKDTTIQWLRNNLSFQSKDAQCVSFGEPELLMDAHFNEPFLVLDFVVQCNSGKPSSLHYQGIFQHNSGHKLVVNLTATANQQTSRILDRNNRSLKLGIESDGWWQTTKEYTKQGVIHILIGLDHIMFLLCLLLAAVMINHRGQSTNIKSMVWQVLGLVTAFTLAHSVTLVLTALNWLSFPSRWVEIIIALTVALTALNNVWPFIQRLLWVTFAFGLVHGMGFAGVLGELGLPSDAKLLPILTFNLGVELGQLMLIALILPLLLWFRVQFKQAQILFKIMSLLIVLLAIYWVIERF